MKQNALFIGVLGLLVGGGLTYVVMTWPATTTTEHMGQMNTSQSITPGAHGANMTMADMTHYKGKQMMPLMLHLSK